VTSTFEAELRQQNRKILVCRKDLDLTKTYVNVIVIFEVEESRGSAGGRAAGYGSRRISKIMCFSNEHGNYNKIFESCDDQTILQFEIPYSAVALDIKLADGTQLVIQGVIDPEKVESYMPLIKEKSFQSPDE
jgi:hypothetical protein